jgi:hypothetical protein
MTSIQSPQTSALTGLRYAPTPKGPCGIRIFRSGSQPPEWQNRNGSAMCGGLRNLESRKTPEALFPACSSSDGGVSR